MGFDLKELTSDEILFRIKTEADPWPLGSLILLAYGYEYNEFDWHQPSNAFPFRQFSTLLQATNELTGKTRLNFVSKGSPIAGGLIECWVKKSEFCRWVSKNWPDDQKIKKFLSLYDHYKKGSSGHSPKLVSIRARVKEYADQQQIEQFRQHIESKHAEIFTANISDIAHSAKTALPALANMKHATIRRYIVRMKVDELLLHVKSSEG